MTCGHDDSTINIVLITIIIIIIIILGIPYYRNDMFVYMT